MHKPHFCVTFHKWKVNIANGFYFSFFIAQALSACTFVLFFLFCFLKPGILTHLKK